MVGVCECQRSIRTSSSNEIPYLKIGSPSAIYAWVFPRSSRNGICDLRNNGSDSEKCYAIFSPIKTDLGYIAIAIANPLKKQARAQFAQDQSKGSVQIGLSQEPIQNFLKCLELPWMVKIFIILNIMRKILKKFFWNTLYLNILSWSVGDLCSWKWLWLSLIHIWRCRRSTLCRSRWSPYH